MTTEALALSDAAVAAGFAPSIHNTQPWRWRLAADELDLYLDRSRSLGVSDPESRLAILSCGAALHHALVSLAADGWHSILGRLPDGAEPDHLAQLRVDHRIPVEAAATRHRQVLEVRQTDRRATLSDTVDAAALRAITTAVESAGAGLAVLRPDQVYDLASAADHAQHAESEESAWQAEMGYWTGGSRPLGSGIPDSVIPQDTAQTTVPGRDFGHAGDLPGSGEHDRGATFAVLYGPEDDALGWLRAGEALSAAWLTATELGVSVLPLSATIEVDSTRAAIRHLLADLGYPYLVLRFGVAEAGAAAQPHTPRLPSDQVIERF